MGYVGVPPQSGFITTAKQRVTSSTNNYVDLDHSISSLADVIVWVNFVKQDSTNLSLTTSTRITLGGTLVSSDIVEIAYLGKAVATQTPSSGTVTNDMLAGSIANSKLANSSITLNGSAVSLGGSATVGETNTPCFLSFKTANTTFVNGAFTVLVNTSIVTNDDNTYDTSNGRFTCPSNGDGTYYMYGSFRVNNYDPERLQGAFYVNGSQLAHSLQETVPDGSVSGRHPSMMISMLMNLSATDYVEFRGLQQSGSNDTVFQSVFGGFKIR